MNVTAGPLAIPVETGESFDFGGFGVRWKLEGHHADGRFAIVHHPLAPRALAAPLHYHHNEDEFSFVLSGTLGALLGEEVVIATAGTWVRKPRRQWHTFWNADDVPCEIIEIISPGRLRELLSRGCGRLGQCGPIRRHQSEIFSGDAIR